MLNKLENQEKKLINKNKKLQKQNDRVTEKLVQIGGEDVMQEMN